MTAVLEDPVDPDLQADADKRLYAIGVERTCSAYDVRLLGRHLHFEESIVNEYSIVPHLHSRYQVAHVQEFRGHPVSFVCSET